MPDLDTAVVDLCRRNPRKRKSKTRPRRVRRFAVRSVQALFRRRRHQPKRPVLAKPYEFRTMAKLLEHEERKWLSGLLGKPGETDARREMTLK